MSKSVIPAKEAVTELKNLGVVKIFDLSDRARINDWHLGNGPKTPKSEFKKSFVTAAKAGNHFFNRTNMDTRFRGNDGIKT